MNKLKKFLALLSAGTMLIGGTAMSSMTASADASLVPIDDIIAMHQWTEFLESEGIPFSTMGNDDLLTLKNMIKEKGITATEICEHLDDIKELKKMFKEAGISDEEIDWNFLCYIMGMKMAYENNTAHLAIPGKSERYDEISRDLEKQGYEWVGDHWIFDIEAYLQSQGRFEKPADILENEKVEGDVNGDGIFNISDVVMLQKALSISEATLDMDVNGDGKVNVFDVVALKRMLTEDLGNVKPI